MDVSTHDHENVVCGCLFLYNLVSSQGGLWDQFQGVVKDHRCLWGDLFLYEVQSKTVILLAWDLGGLLV